MKQFVSLRMLFSLLAIALLSMTAVTENFRVEGSTAYASTTVPAPGPGRKKVVLKSLGMSCPFCKAAISAKLKQLPGVIAYEVDLKSDSATVLYDPAKVTVEELKKAVAEAGFQVRAVEEVGK